MDRTQKKESAFHVLRASSLSGGMETVKKLDTPATVITTSGNGPYCGLA